MKKLNKKQRHEAYKKAHTIISNLQWDDYEFTCHAIEAALNDTVTISSNTELFPEFDLFKPKEGAFAWFEAEHGFPEDYIDKAVKEAQKTILEFCIEMTKTK